MGELPEAVRAFVASTVGAPRRVVRVGGGDTSAAARVETRAGAVFVKWASGDAGATYAAEADGLAALAPVAAPGLVVPEPLAWRLADPDGPGAVVLPWLDAGDRPGADWQRFGRALRQMHAHEPPGEGYGWHADNWIGSKPQRNGWHADWPAFFGAQRLLAQREVVCARGAWDVAWDPLLTRLVARLPELLPATPPRSLVHGDLWAGNAMPLEAGPGAGRFALIDPAVYVGHGEVDLAMMDLFGGFGEARTGYEAEGPTDSGYQDRRELYNLYHLINHLTHGPQYRAPVEATLRRFGG